MRSVVSSAREDVGFYPTPPELASKMLSFLDWRQVMSILEPSAGKGNIVDEIQKKACYERGGRYGKTGITVDCVEIDPDLRAILESRYGNDRVQDIQRRLRDMRDMRYEDRPSNYDAEYASLDSELSAIKGTPAYIVADDFLSFRTFKQYDAIIMNPPFDTGDLHLLHAIELEKSGGTIVCLLNAETIRNPFTNTRKALKQQLEKYGAKIQFIRNAFSGSERRTDVEIVLVVIEIPMKEKESFIFEELKKAKEEKKANTEAKSVAEGGFLEQIVDQFNFEVEGTIRLIREYEAMKPYMLCSFDDKSAGSILTLSLAKDERNYSQICDVNKYLQIVRMKYWTALFKNKEFTGALTSNLLEKYFNMVESMGDYDFTLYNITILHRKMMSEISSAVGDTILALFEKLSSQHSWFPECETNIHYFNGWATNKAHMINTKKVILPMYGMFASSYHGGVLNEWKVVEEMSDIEKVFNYLSSCEPIGGPDLAEQIKIYSASGITKKIPLKYFWVTFYKKGTCHIEWRVPELVEKLNIFGCQRKNWLPPSYGKKRYSEMTREEKTVIDEFQGEEEYEKVLERADYYLSTGTDQLLLMGGKNE